MDYKIPNIGSICVSLMGHDKGRGYVVVAVLSSDFVLVADGRVRKLDNPKQKRFKHLKVLSNSESCASKIANGSISNDIIVKEIKNIYN